MTIQVLRQAALAAMVIPCCVIIAYASREGQTDKIAHHVAHRLEDDGALVRLIDLKAHETEAGADDCDAMIIAGSVHIGQFDPELSSFVMRHGEALRRCPSAFLPVSLSAASHEESERSAIDEIAQRFVAEHGWKPDVVYHVAGAVHDLSIPSSGWSFTPSSIPKASSGTHLAIRS